MVNIHIGEVRSIDDPTHSGCIQVRLFNRQNDENDIKDEHLKWATPLHPVTSAATAGVGIIPAGMVAGSRVLITYLEDDTAEQYPIIIGTLGRGELPNEKGLGKRSDTQSAGKTEKDKAGPDNPVGPATGKAT
jgi:hypothetical protein